METIIVFLRMVKYYLLFCMIVVKSFWIHNFTEYKQVIYVLSTPRHGNLGDQAIVYSQYKFFDELGCGKRVIEINKDAYALFKEKFIRMTKSDDLIVINGGGNIGTLWPSEEQIIRDIIKNYVANSIIIMPQTAYFEDSSFGKKELECSIAAYCCHPDLAIFCRDIDTYNLISKKFIGVKSFLVPDMVLFLSECFQQHCRKGALLCLRGDLEKICCDATEKEIIDFLNQLNYNVAKTSTLANQMVDSWQRKRLLKKKWNEFSKAELIITDRFHGMVFAAITSTPCLAIDNISHKVKNGYNWISNLPYIIYCDDACGIIEQLKLTINVSKKQYSYSNVQLKQEYDDMKKYFESKLKTCG